VCPSAAPWHCPAMLWLTRWGRAGQGEGRIVVGTRCAYVACLGFGVGGGHLAKLSPLAKRWLTAWEREYTICRRKFIVYLSD
jgi:hypothetical protein